MNCYLLNLIKSSTVACCVLIYGMAYPCGGINQQVYSGKVEYTLDSLNPLLCTLTVTLDFDINELIKNDSIWVDWGDYYVTTIHATSITEDSAASAIMSPTRIYTHVYSGSHVYATVPPADYYYISFQNEYRINGVTNIAQGGGINLPFYLQVQLSIDTTPGKQYEPLQFSPLTIGFTGLSSFTQTGLQQIDKNSDSSAYSFTTPLETISNPVPEYQYPDQFCVANGSSSDIFSIDPVTGNISWSDACLQGIFCYGTQLNKYRNGRLISSVMREQNIYVIADGTLGINPVSDAIGIEMFPNPTQNNLIGTIKTSTPLFDNFVSIVSADGRVVKPNIPIINDRFETDASQLAPGIYFVRLNYAEGILTAKFIKQ